MTAAVVGVLLALVALTWGAAGAVARRPALPAEPGADEGAAVPAGVTRWPGSDWLAARRRRGRAERAESEALELLDGLAPALRAGLPPAAAMRLVMSSRPSASLASAWWTDLDVTAGRGDPLAPAWWAYAAAVDSDDLRLVAATWSLCEALGSPLAPTVATTAEVVRRRRAARQRIAAGLAGPRATMRVLTALPLTGPVVAVAVGVAPSELYVGVAGLSSLVVGLALLLLGRLWASRMVRAVTAERDGRGTRRLREVTRGRR